MKQNQLYLLVGVLAAIVVGLAIYIWREESRPSGVEIRLDQNGISIEEN